MNLYEKLVSGYPSGDVSPQDFIDHLTIGADGWVGAWIAIALAVVFGLLVYIIPIYITEKEKMGPYPLWLHTFYCAADFMHGRTMIISCCSFCWQSEKRFGSEWRSTVFRER